MNLKELNDIDNDIKKSEIKYRQLIIGQGKLAESRKLSFGFSQMFISTFSNSYHSHVFGDAKSRQSEIVYEILNEMKHEILRLAEMRLAEEARKLKIQMDVKKKIINVSILQGEENE